MKTSTQLKALVRNLSKAKHVEAEIIQRNFMLERFLERISLSEYKNSFILNVDITTEDFVTPRQVQYTFQLMFEDRTISILAYNPETVLAEKFETIITRSVTTSRMRDFYDIYILTYTQPFDSDIFKTALSKTVENRGTSEQMADTHGVIKAITDNTILINLWQRYQKKYNYAADVSWEMAIDALNKLAKMI